MTAERKHESAGFIVGVILMFTFVMSIELVIPNVRPFFKLPVHILFTAARALLANLFILTITRWINVQLDRIIPWYPSALKRLVIQGLITVVISAIIVSALVEILIGFVAPYTDKVVVEWRVIIFSNLFALVLSTLYTGVYFFNQWGRSLADVEQLKLEHLQSQFNVLKQQLNPHFLFNSFSTLASLQSENPQKASDFVQKLSNIYRYILQATNQDVINIEAEIQAAHAYTYLQQTRFGENLQVNVCIPDKYKNLFIAPLTLQILLENAIKHNIISTDKPLHVDVSIDGDDWLVVKNNVQKKSSVEPGTQVGLKNIVNRYRILSNRTVEILEGDSKFIVRIPLFKKDSI